MFVKVATDFIHRAICTLCVFHRHRPDTGTSPLKIKKNLRGIQPFSSRRGSTALRVALVVSRGLDERTSTPARVG